MDQTTEQLLRDLRHRLDVDAGALHVWNDHRSTPTWIDCSLVICASARDLIARIDMQLPTPEPAIGTVVLRKIGDHEMPQAWQRRDVREDDPDPWYGPGGDWMSWTDLQIGAELTVIWTPEDES